MIVVGKLVTYSQSLDHLISLSHPSILDKVALLVFVPVNINTLRMESDGIINTYTLNTCLVTCIIIFMNAQVHGSL